MQRVGYQINAFVKSLKNLVTGPHFLFLTLAGNSTVFLFAWLFYLVEADINQEINRPIDAIWWAFATVTTVGYGDITPDTFWGRILGIFLMLIGTALFACYIALFSDAFMALDLVKNNDSKN